MSSIRHFWTERRGDFFPCHGSRWEAAVKQSRSELEVSTSWRRIRVCSGVSVSCRARSRDSSPTQHIYEHIIVACPTFTSRPCCIFQWTTRATFSNCFFNRPTPLTACNIQNITSYKNNLLFIYMLNVLVRTQLSKILNIGLHLSQIFFRFVRNTNRCSDVRILSSELWAMEPQNSIVSKHVS